MVLTPGTRLGPFDIVAPLGVGGMGEVYRAMDVHLKRQVALKVLPDALAADADRLARFQREAEVLAALNHPHIAAIYGLEKTPELTALVMELVEGEDLSQRLSRPSTRAQGVPSGVEGRGPLPLDEVLPIARQIAEALEAAHEAGIIHRDLKPANIKVRADGTVKVLDFGLAKALDQDFKTSGPQDLANSPTITSPLTVHGMILGTAAYMSPEQARGKAVDKRADIWAFGCVLYEMLTGRRAFPGDDISEVIASVLRDAPDLGSLPALVPPRVRLLLADCFVRDPKHRLRDIGEARRALSATGESGTAGEAPAATVTAGPSAWRRAALGAAAVLAGAALAIGGMRAVARPATHAPLTLQELPPAGTEFVGAPIASPDGQTLAMIARGQDGQTSIWIRALDSETARLVEGTSGASQVFWSSDSEHLGFKAGNELRRVPRQGGAIRKVCDIVGAARPYRQGVWTADDEILFATTTQGIVRVAATGGLPRTIIREDGVQYDSLNILPDTRHLLYLEFGRRSGIYTAALDGTDRRPLMEGDFLAATLVGTATLVYQPDRAIFSRRLKSGGREVDGEPVPVAEDIVGTAVEGGPAGVLSVVRETRQQSLSWFDRQGTVLSRVGPVGRYEQVRLSPDGTRALFVRADPAATNRDLWLLDFARRTETRLTFDPAADHLAAFSPDGSQVAWESHAGGVRILRRPTDGSSPPALVVDWGHALSGVTWSRDGRFILFASNDGPTLQNLWLAPVDGSAKPSQLLVSPFSELEGAFSPDGRFLAYVSDETGRLEVYVQPVEGIALTGSKRQVSLNGGRRPQWRRDGRELFFAGLDRVVMSAPVSSDGRGLDAGVPVPLFDARAAGIAAVDLPCDVTGDGQRFLCVVEVKTDRAQPASVFLNWTLR